MMNYTIGEGTEWRNGGRLVWAFAGNLQVDLVALATLLTPKFAIATVTVSTVPAIENTSRRRMLSDD